MPEYWNKQPIGFNGVKELGFMDNLFANPEYFKNLQWVALRGGEPLYDERCYEVLKWFVDNGIAKNVALDISTNATVFEDRFKEIFKEFKHIELLISIEATDDLYSVIRGGNYTWEDLNDNLEKFYAEDNIEVTFAVTVMTTNIFNLDKVWDWFYTNHRKRASISMTNVVVTPAYLNIAHMPRELKDLALEKMEHIPSMEMWPIANSRVEMFEYQTGIDDIRAGLRRDVNEEEATKYWDWFLKYTKDLDRLRDTNTFKSIPEMEKYK
jgi:sulfatase maturation enzyme AslB (radical SAM superfamily)